MIKKIKFGKIFIVFFLTALIWVWADLALDERLDLPNVVIEVAKSTDPALWVSFVAPGEPDADPQASITLDSVVLKGPAWRVTDVDRMMNTGALNLTLFLVPEREELTAEGDSTWNVLDFLKRSDEIRQLGLTVESCAPRMLAVRVRKLVKRSVPVECIGLGPSLEVASLEPSRVDAYVSDEVRRATIHLTAAEQEQAKNGPVARTPYIELAPGQRREVSEKVRVRLAPAENILDPYSVTPATLGVCFSRNLQGKYQVVLENDNDPALAVVRIRATPAAYKAYFEAPYQMILHVLDSDRQQESVTREVVFSFPEEYLRRNEIKADQPPQTVKFTLAPVSGATGESEP
jgi:hypothetical protein